MLPPHGPPRGFRSAFPARQTARHTDEPGEVPALPSRTSAERRRESEKAPSCGSKKVRPRARGHCREVFTLNTFKHKQVRLTFIKGVWPAVPDAVYPDSPFWYLRRKREMKTED